MFLGLRTALFHAPDLAKAKAWYTKILGIQPYFDEPFYVGFNVGGFELGLDPDGKKLPAGATGVAVYWGVKRIEPVLEHLLANGATPHSGVQNVGEGIRVASVLDPFANIFGIIENPHFKLPKQPKPRAKKKKPAAVKLVAKPTPKAQAAPPPKAKPVKAAVVKKSRPATRVKKSARRT